MSFIECSSGCSFDSANEYARGAIKVFLMFFGVHHGSNLLEFFSICILNLFYLGKLIIILRSVNGKIRLFTFY